MNDDDNTTLVTYHGWHVHHNTVSVIFDKIEEEHSMIVDAPNWVIDLGLWIGMILSGTIAVAAMLFTLRITLTCTTP